MFTTNTMRLYLFFLIKILSVYRRDGCGYGINHHDFLIFLFVRCMQTF